MLKPLRLVADRPLGCQLALLVAGALLLAGWPPREGALLLVPLGSANVVPLAIDRGALLVGSGPLPRSYVVRGSRSALAPAMLRAGILVLSGTAAGCASDRTTA